MEKLPIPFCIGEKGGHITNSVLYHHNCHRLVIYVPAYEQTQQLPMSPCSKPRILFKVSEEY